MQLNIAINYGGRAELVDAVKALVADARNAPIEIDETAIAARLYTAGLPDPDLLIRTSGEMRVSNFLLWQIAYAELYVTEVLWPDFTRTELLRAILDYQKRDRRFGGLGEPLQERPAAVGPAEELETVGVTTPGAWRAPRVRRAPPHDPETIAPHPFCASSSE